MSLVSSRDLEFRLGMDRRQLQNLAAKAGRFYEPFDVPKRSGGVRHIDNPVGLLKEVQGRIYRRILHRVDLPPNMVGGVAKRSVRDNALAHVGQPTLVKLDLRNHYGRITNEDVFDALRRELRCGTDIASLLTRLTTVQRRLPQGASTSSMLANLVLLPAHREISLLAIERGCQYTLFVDDLSISGARARDLIQPVIEVLHRHGFALAKGKLEILDKGDRQETTGLVVNQRVAISRSDREEIRRDILWYSSLSCISEREFHSLMGRIRYTGFISPEKGRALAELAQRCLPRTVEGEVLREQDRRLPCRGNHRYRPAGGARTSSSATAAGLRPSGARTSNSAIAADCGVERLELAT